MLRSTILRTLGFIVLVCFIALAVSPAYAQDAPALPVAGITFSDDTLAALITAVLGIVGTLVIYVLRQRGQESNALATSIPLPFAQMIFASLMEGADQTADPLDNNKLIEEARLLGWDATQDALGGYILRRPQGVKASMSLPPRDSPTGM